MASTGELLVKEVRSPRPLSFLQAAFIPKAAVLEPESPVFLALLHHTSAAEGCLSQVSGGDVRVRGGSGTALF